MYSKRVSLEIPQNVLDYSDSPGIKNKNLIVEKLIRNSYEA